MILNLLWKVSEEIIADIDLVIISPGMPPDNYVEQLRSANLPRVNRAIRCQGQGYWNNRTNGKTTTTFLTGEILKTFLKMSM